MESKKLKLGSWIVGILIYISAGNAFSEIKDKEIYNNLLNSCIKSGPDIFSYEIVSNYCTCTADATVKQFTKKELILFEKKLHNLSDDEKIEVLVANEKMLEIATSCMEEALNQ